MDNSLIRHNGSAFKRFIYLTLGILLVGIGILGIVLPILPTTIFLILASACFVKSSPAMNAWLKRNKILGVYIRNYQDKAGMSIAAKVSTILFLWAGILASGYFFTENTAVRIILLIIAAGVSIHIFTIKTAETNELNKMDEDSTAN